MDCRFRRDALIRKIKRIALYREHIHLTSMDATQYIRFELKKLPHHALVNLDPPYYRAGPDLYPYAYQHHDHLALPNAVRKMPHRWMLTYDDAPEICAKYPGLTDYRKTLTYSAHGKRFAKELFILSDDLTPTALVVAA